MPSFGLWTHPSLRAILQQDWWALVSVFRLLSIGLNAIWAQRPPCEVTGLDYGGRGHSRSGRDNRQLVVPAATPSLRTAAFPSLWTQ